MIYLKKIFRNNRGITIKQIVILMVGIMVLRITWQNFQDESVYKGKGFSIVGPYGWEKTIDKKKHTVTYVCPVKDYETEIPEALMSFYSEKTTGALFLDDYIIQVKESLMMSGLPILDKGEIKISGLIFKWVIYKNKNPKLLVLSFYGVDEFNVLYQIQYAAIPSKFDKYQNVFEMVKDSFVHNKFGM